LKYVFMDSFNTLTESTCNSIEYLVIL